MVTPLMREATILRALTKKKRAGFPAFYKFYKFGRECVLEMELLGPSLEARHQACNRQFSPSTLLNVGVQTLSRLEQLHACNYIHRDVKPANMATSRNKRSTVVYLLDFGLARQYCDRVTKLHLPANTNHSFVGSRLYSSVNVDLKLAPSRRDDLESWFYCLMEWMHGRLPWQLRTKDKSELVTVKQTTTARELIQTGSNNYCKIFQHIRGLAYDQAPDYKFIRFHLAIEEQSLGFTFTKFDWQETRPKRRVQKSEGGRQKRKQTPSRKSRRKSLRSEYETQNLGITELNRSSICRSILLESTCILPNLSELFAFSREEEDGFIEEGSEILGLQPPTRATAYQDLSVLKEAAEFMAKDEIVNGFPGRVAASLSLPFGPPEDAIVATD